MKEYLQAFVLGNAAILGNVCMLPLYPGLMAMLASRAADSKAKGIRFMGAIVLAGIISVMVAIGALLHSVRTSAADVLPYALPVLYGLVLVLGVAMVFGRNPFARMSSAQAPILKSPNGTAFVYGMMLGPMTLPCTGPLIISAFVIGGASGTGALLDSVAYFIAFGLGFGWPLVLLPMIAAPLQRRMTRFLTSNHKAISIVSGALLIAVAAIGILNDVVPNA
jgi:cytochrome c-type biogenesis protein